MFPALLGLLFFFLYWCNCGKFAGASKHRFPGTLEKYIVILLFERSAASVLLHTDVCL